MFIKRFSILFFLIISGQIFTTTSIAEEKNDLMSIYKSCLESNVAELDDGISDAKTIAHALSLACNKEYLDAFTFFSKSLKNKQQRNIFMEQANLKESKIELALPKVLEYRAYLRKNPNMSKDAGAN